MKNLLIYYGWLNSFNSATNAWDNKKVALEMAKYDLVVLGDGIQNSSHGDYSNTQIVIPRIMELNPNAKIFGYVTINQSYENFKTKVDEWNALEVQGIFCDEAGYDYGSTNTNGRQAFNDKLDYIHSRPYSNIAFVNAWNQEHIFGTNNDASYPDSTWNPDGFNSNINDCDWYLLESFGITSTPSFESASQWYNRGCAAQNLPCNIAGCSVISDTDGNGNDKMAFIYTSGMIFNLDAVGSSDVYYGASSAKSKMWDRPDTKCLYYDIVGPCVQCDLDTDVYHKYLYGGKLEIDFSSGSETSSITRY